MPRAKKETKEIKETKKPVKVEKKTAVKAAKTAVKKPAAKAVKAEKPVKVVEKKAEKLEKVAEKVKPVKKTKESKEDTGSVDFQINNFSDKIKLLAKHLKTHPHDFDSRRGLLIMVGKRRRLLNYLKKSDVAKYEEVSKSLKLKA